MQRITSPQEFFGFTPGDDYKMIHWNKLVEYYELLAGQSDRMILEHMGLTSEGNRFIHLVISSAENMKELDHHQAVSRRLGDPRGLSREEIKALAKNGKAICMQSYGLHSNEVGGAQMCPLLVYDLLTADKESELYEVLQNVVFVMVPCADPDGEIVFTDWYHKYLGTRYEGCCSPYLRHNYAGHSNNRDALHENVIESTYMVDLLVHRYWPQVYQDHHHQCPMHDRMSITPAVGRLPDAINPMTFRDQAFYGAAMARALEEAGRKGIVMGDEKFDAYPVNSFYGMAMLHNTTGMLTESADALIATPLYIYPEQLVGESHIDRSHVCPSPWPGGWWHLSDIVNQMYIASVALLKTVARNREQILRDMAEKARRQMKRGEDSREQAYLISLEQHDASALHRLLTMLTRQKADMLCAEESFVSDGRYYPAGTIIVPLNQPNYGAVRMLLSPGSIVENNRYSNDSRPSDSSDGFYSWFTRYMGLDVYPANAPVTVRTSIYNHVPWQERSLPLPGSENDSYRVANNLLASGQKLYRDKSGAFHGESADGRTEIRAARIGLLKNTQTGNEEEGFARNLLRRYDFPFRIVMDREWWEGIPKDIDVLILPGDPEEKLLSGDQIPLNAPPEYQAGLGTQGTQNVRTFVENGGRLIAWERSCRYVINLFKLPIVEKTAGLTKAEYNPLMSLFRIKLTDDPLCLGMKDEADAWVHWNAPALAIRTYSWGLHNSEKWSAAARFADGDDTVVWGKPKGAELLSDTPCVLRIPYGKGEIVLYTFDPKFRAQTDGTYKLWFNAMYN